MKIILEMSLIDWVIFWLTISSFGFLIKGILTTEKDDSQVALTWFLYFLLDTVLMFATISVCFKNGGGGYQILFASAICSFLMFIILLYQKRNTWTWLEIMIVILIIICGGTWFIKGPYETVVLGVISESIVGTYLIIKTFRYPKVKYNLIGYLLFLIASFIATCDAKDWSWPERGYSLSEVFLTSITIIPLIKKWWKNKKNLA